MKHQTLKWAAATLLPAVTLAFTSCSTMEGNEDVAAIETPDGAIIVDTLTTSAKVTAIDAAKRKLTLVFPDGKKTTYKCGPDVVNFPQIQVGDQVNAKLTEEAAIFIGSGAPPSDMAGVGVALAPVGYKPEGEFVETEQVTAKVLPSTRSITKSLSSSAMALPRRSKSARRSTWLQCPLAPMSPFR